MKFQTAWKQQEFLQNPPSLVYGQQKLESANGLFPVTPKCRWLFQLSLPLKISLPGSDIPGLIHTNLTLSSGSWTCPGA